MEYMLINSKEKITGTPSNFTLQFNEGFVDVVKLQLQQGFVPYTWYNISVYGTPTLIFLESAGGGVVSVPITLQHYTNATLATEVQNLLNANSPNGLTYTVTFDSATNKYTFNSTGAFSLLFGSQDTGGMDEFLGFDLQDTTAATSVTSTNASVLTIPYILVSVDRFGDYVQQSTTSGGTFLLPVTGNYSDLLLFQQNLNDTQVLCFDPKISFKQLKVSLYSPSGNLLDMNGGNVQFKFILYKE